MSFAGFKYDDFIAPQNDRGEFSYNQIASVQYPEQDQVNIFGPLYLPRVYGKDLTSFEIASSGSVAITLNDIHSFDLTRDNENSNIVLQTYADDSFYINVGSSNMYLGMDASSNHATLWSTSNVTIHADDVLTLEGDTVELVIGQDFNLGAKNISMTADSNVAVTGTNGSVKLSASNDNILFNMEDNNALLYASNNVSVSASNDLFVAAQSNVYITASNTNMVLSAGEDTMNVTMDAALDKMTVRADGGVEVTSTSNVSLLAAGGTSFVKLDSASGDIDIATSADITIDASSELTMTSINKCTVNAGLSIEMTTGSNMTIQAASNFSLTAEEDITVESVSASLNLQANGGKVYASFDATNNSLSIGSSNNISTTASNAYSVVAGSSITMDAQTSSLNLSANGGKVFANFDATNDSLVIGASNNISVTASNNLSMIVDQNALLEAASNLTLIGESNVFLKRDDQNMIAVNNDNTITFVTNGNTLITANNRTLSIDGDVEVRGTISSIDIVQSNLLIENAKLTLAYDPDNLPVPDGPANDKSGIYVAGTYGGESNARSLSWNWNGGMDKLGTPNVDEESYWDLRGGALHISHSNETDEVTFGFRINAGGELELVKKTKNSPLFKRIAKFGKTLM